MLKKVSLPNVKVCPDNEKTDTQLPPVTYSIPRLQDPPVESGLQSAFNRCAE
jgi:hypothetical protein